MRYTSDERFLFSCSYLLIGDRSEMIDYRTREPLSSYLFFTIKEPHLIQLIMQVAHLPNIIKYMSVQLLSKVSDS